MNHKSSPMPSERSFGIMLMTIFAGFGIYEFWSDARLDDCITWLAIALLIGLITLTIPRLLKPFNKAWFIFGQFLSRITSPIVLGIIFFGLLTPIALIARYFGRDELRLRCQIKSSYWIDRTPPGPAPNSFKNQF